jgi:hypothetical protein
MCKRSSLADGFVIDIFEALRGEMQLLEINPLVPWFQ